MAGGEQEQQDGMERAVGDLEETREGDTHILIPDKENKEKTTKTGNAGKLLIILGLVTFLVSLVISLGSWEQAAPAYGIVTGLHLSLLGLLILLQLPERKELEIVVNGRQVASALPFRAIAFTVTNLAFSLAGILVVSLVGPWCCWPAWNIVGLLLSLLVAGGTLLPWISARMTLPDRLSADPLKQTLLQMHLDASLHSGFGSLTGATEPKLQALVAWLAASTVSLLPALPTFSLKDPAALARRPLHYAAIALVMLLAAAVFSAQVTDVITGPGKEDRPLAVPGWMAGWLEDPDNTYARRWSIADMRLSDAKLMVLVSAPVTLLLCLALLLLTRRASALHTLLAALLALGMAAFHCFLSTISLSWMILLAPSSVSTLSLNLRMGIALAEPLLAAALTALALSYLGSLLQRKEGTEEPHTRCRRGATGLATVAALVTIGLAMTALALTSDNMMTSLSGHWNTTESTRYQSDCPEGAARNQRRNYPHYYYDDEGVRRMQTTTTTSPASWPDHCFGVSLDGRLNEVFTSFNLSQLGLSWSLLVLGLLVLLAGTQLHRTILLGLGVSIFGSSIATTIFYFISLIDYVDANIFIICEVIAGMVVGLGLTFAGCGSFLDLLSALLKTFLAATSLTGLLILSLVGAVIALARLTVKASTVKEKENKLQEVEA